MIALLNEQFCLVYSDRVLDKDTEAVKTNDTVITDCNNRYPIQLTDQKQRKKNTNLQLRCYKHLVIRGCNILTAVCTLSSICHMNMSFFCMNNWIHCYRTIKKYMCSFYSTCLALEMFTECVKPCKSSHNEYSRIRCQNMAV